MRISTGDAVGELIQIRFAQQDGSGAGQLSCHGRVPRLE